MDAVKTGTLIAALRKEKGYTQKELAAMLNVTDKAVSKWERGLNFPEITLLEQIAQALDTSVIHLLFLEDATKQEAVSAISTVAIEEKAKLIKDLKFKSWVKLIYEIILFAALLCASKIFADHGIYGLAQVATMGMLGYTSTLISFEIDLLKSFRILKQ